MLNLAGARFLYGWRLRVLPLSEHQNGVAVIRGDSFDKGERDYF